MSGQRTGSCLEPKLSGFMFWCSLFVKPELCARLAMQREQEFPTAGSQLFSDENAPEVCQSRMHLQEKER